MPRVIVSIPELGVTGKGETNKEIYVLGFAADASGSSGMTVGDLDALDLPAVPNVAPIVSKHAALKYLFASASNMFYKIKKGQPVSLGGDGIILYPYLDPGPMLSVHFVVVECDSDSFDAGKLIGEVISDLKVTSALDAVLGMLPGPKIVGTLLGAVSRVLPGLLKKMTDDDDPYFAHTYSGFDFTRYGLNGESQKEFVLRNEMVELKLRVQIAP